MRVAGQALSWVKGHKLWTAAIALVVLWLVVRWFAGTNRGGHATPEDAIAAGWMVYPAGIGGWKEVNPDETQEFWHMTGWTGDPFAKPG